MLNAVSDTNSNLMEREDAWFCKPAYVSALSGYLTANHITREQFEQSEEIRAEARGYAIREAQRATYRDYNNFSNFIASLGRGRASNAVEKVAGSLMEGVLPFRRTPANILVRTMEYSPVGLLRGIKQTLVDIRSGKKTAAEALDTLSAGLVGTGLAALDCCSSSRAS